MEICHARWILARLYEPDLAIIDCRTEMDYLKSRVPGSISLQLLDGADFENMLGRAGIDETTRIVLYEQGEFSFENHIYKKFEALGHARLFLLSGGFDTWTRLGFPVQFEQPSIRIPTFYKKI
jgi:thiosulfate/3-mercaptopyruvate sulfurtransferase